MIRLLLINLLIYILLIGCTSHSTNTLKSNKVTIDEREMLYGLIDRQQLYYDYPAWKLIEEDYKPNENVIKELRKIESSISVEIFLGTWCSDSEREVPAFFKIIDSTGITEYMNIDIWAVDRAKALDSNLAQLRHIEFVPTFIFYKSKKEIGRIIEMPENLLEEDILNIIQNSTL